MLFFFKTLVSWRRFIVFSGLGGAAIMVVVGFLLPKWFTATASILPPDTQSRGVPIFTELMQSLQMPLMGSIASGARAETIYIDMLKSRRIGSQLIDEFGLDEVWGTEVIEESLDELHSRTRYNLLENGLLMVSFEDRDPERAADVANRMVEILDEFNRSLNVGRASRTRQFVGEQLGEREGTLAQAEQAVRDFQAENQALELDEQLRSALTIIADLTGEAIALETELKILAHYTSTGSEEYTRKKTEYDEVVIQLTKLKTRSAGSDGDLVRSYLPTLERVPDLALELLRLQRNVQIEAAVYKMLVSEYEQARIEEARDTPTLQVLDTAAAPNLRSRPKRKILVLIGGLVGSGWSAFIALFVSAWRENRERSRVFVEVLNPLIGDVTRPFRRRKP